MTSLRSVVWCAVLSLLPLFATAQGPAKLKAIYINTADEAVQVRFWTQLLPCRTERNGADCTGAMVNFTAKAPTGPSVGSVIDHIGFFVPSLDPYYAKVSEAGYKYRRIATGNQIIIEGPDGASVELTSDPTHEEPIRFHHIHFHTPDPKAMQAWYAKVLGAVPGRRAQWEAGDLPGANLTYAPSNGPVAPTAGRAIARIDFEVNNVRRVGDIVRALGVECREISVVTGRDAVTSGDFVDPWGTSVRLIQRQTLVFK
jgi:catechol 2,3-dioxygenase-like lactoylglutathione lyase family enzyme